MAGNLDYGMIAQALGALALGKGIKSYSNARSVNNYANRMGVDYNVGNFYGGNPDDAVSAINELYKTQKQARMDQAELEDINAHLGQGVTPFRNVKAAQSYYTGASIPEAKAQMERTRKVQEANPLRDLVQSQPGLFFPGAGGVRNADGYTDGIMDDGTGNPMIQTGTGRIAGLPDFTDMTSEEIYKTIDTNRATSGENRALNDDARKQADEGRKAELQPYQVRLKELSVQKTIQEIARLKQMHDLNPKLYAARIAALNRSNRGGGGSNRMFSPEIDFLIRQGRPMAEIEQLVLDKMSGASSGVTHTWEEKVDGVTHKYSERVTSKGKGGGAGRPPGKPLKVNGFTIPTRGGG